MKLFHMLTLQWYNCVNNVIQIVAYNIWYCRHTLRAEQTVLWIPQLIFFGLGQLCMHYGADSSACMQMCAWMDMKMVDLTEAEWQAAGFTPFPIPHSIPSHVTLLSMNMGNLPHTAWSLCLSLSLSLFSTCIAVNLPEGKIFTMKIWFHVGYFICSFINFHSDTLIQFHHTAYILVSRRFQ